MWTSEVPRTRNSELGLGAWGLVPHLEFPEHLDSPGHLNSFSASQVSFPFPPFNRHPTRNTAFDSGLDLLVRPLPRTRDLREPASEM